MAMSLMLKWSFRIAFFFRHRRWPPLRFRLWRRSRLRPLPKKLNLIRNHGEFGAFLVRGFILPFREVEATADKNALALATILRKILGGFPKHVYVNKRDFLLLFSALGFPSAVDGQAHLGDGGSLWSVSNLRVAG